MSRDWNDLSQRDKRRTMGSLAGLYGTPSTDTGELADDVESGEVVRAKPVQHEAKAATALATQAGRMWWGRYLRHHEAATASRREGSRNRAAGQQQGWPDYTLIVPERLEGGFFLTDPIRAALELKAEHHRPKRDVDARWWLAWGEELDTKRVAWELRKTTPTRYGVSAYQAITLWELSRAGFSTKVAYGAPEAFEWLNGVATGLAQT